MSFSGLSEVRGVIVVMGVAGSGKTTIGRLLAQELGWQFADADAFHPAANIAKMQQGGPLTDVDRDPWLLALQQAIAVWLQTPTPTVLACSALKAAYRDRLLVGSDHVYLVYLKGSPSLIQHRLSQRQGHYMPADLLPSQFADLQEPETGLTVTIDQSPVAIVQAIRQGLAL